MQHHALIILSVLFHVLFNASTASAAVQPLVAINADLYPGETYHIGVTTDDQGEISQFYYENEKNEVLYYDIKKLQEGYTILEKEGRNVVILSVDYDPFTNTAPVKFQYLYNGLFGSYRSANALLKKNPETQKFELYKNNSDTPVSSAFVAARYLRKTLIGISYIDLR